MYTFGIEKQARRKRSLPPRKLLQGQYRRRWDLLPLPLAETAPSAFRLAHCLHLRLSIAHRQLTIRQK